MWLPLENRPSGRPDARIASSTSTAPAADARRRGRGARACRRRRTRSRGRRQAARMPEYSTTSSSFSSRRYAIDGRRATSSAGGRADRGRGAAGRGARRARSHHRVDLLRGIVSRSSSSSSEIRVPKRSRAPRARAVRVAQLGRTREDSTRSATSGSGGAAGCEVAEEVDDLVGDLRAALAGHDVHHRLGGDELRDRRDHDRPADLRADAAVTPRASRRTARAGAARRACGASC